MTPVTDLYDFGVKFRGKKNRVAQKFRSPARLLRRVVTWDNGRQFRVWDNKIKSAPKQPRRSTLGLLAEVELDSFLASKSDE